MTEQLRDLDAWRSLPIKQQPEYSDQAAVAEVFSELESLPPLVFAGEAATAPRPSPARRATRSATA